MSNIEQYIVSIGTGANQLPLIKAAKALGYKVIGVDQSPASAYLDISITSSTYDSVGTSSKILALKDKFPIKGIVARSSGPPLLTAAHCNKVLGLNGWSEEQAHASISKSELTKVCTQLHIDTPISENHKDIEEITLPVPIVIKPDQPRYGKKNVYLVKNSVVMLPDFIKAQEESLNNCVTIQEYIPGFDLAVSVATKNGEIVWHYPFLEHVSLNSNSFVGRGVSTSCGLISKQIEKNALTIIKKLVRHWGTTGFCFFSFRCSKINNRLYLYEQNPGLCGDNIANLFFKFLWPELNFFEQDINLMTGSIVNLPNDCSHKEVAILDNEVYESQDALKNITKFITRQVNL